MVDARGDALEWAMALAKAPAARITLRERPLPHGMELLLQVAAGASNDTLAEFAAQSGESEADVIEAARFYAREMLFHQGADAYRVLGVPHDAETDTIRTHHRLLQQWLHPDRHTSDWDAIFAARVNAAWSRLRSDQRRQAYDRENPPRERDQMPASLGSPTWLHPQQVGGEDVDPGRWRQRAPVLALFAVCALLAVLAVRDMQREPAEFDVLQTAGSVKADDASQPADVQLALRIPAKANEVARDVKPATTVPAKRVAKPVAAVAVVKPRPNPVAAALPPKPAPKPVAAVAAVKPPRKPVAAALPAKPAPKPVAAVAVVKATPKPVAAALSAKPVAAVAVTKAPPKPVAVVAVAKTPPKPITVALPAKPAAKPAAVVAVAKTPPKPIAVALPAKPAPKPVAAVAAKPPPKPVTIAVPAKPVPKPVTAVAVVKVPPKPLAAALPAKPVPKPVTAVAVAKPPPKSVAVALPTKPAPKPIAPAGKPTTDSVAVAPTIKPRSPPVAVATPAKVAVASKPPMAAPPRTVAAAATASPPEPDAASASVESRAVAVQRTKQAQQVGGQLMSYMAKSGSVIPPIWGSLNTQRGAAQLRGDMHDTGKVRLDAPHWRVSDETASLVAVIRYQDGGVGRLAANLAWREQRWLVTGLSVERDL